MRSRVRRRRALGVDQGGDEALQRTAYVAVGDHALLEDVVHGGDADGRLDRIGAGDAEDLDEVLAGPLGAAG